MIKKQTYQNINVINYDSNCINNIINQDNINLNIN